MNRPTLNKMKKRPSLWFRISSSERTTDLMIAYPSGRVITSSSGMVETDWCKDWMTHKDLVEDYYNGFQFVSWL